MRLVVPLFASVLALATLAQSVPAQSKPAAKPPAGKPSAGKPAAGAKAAPTAAKAPALSKALASLQFAAKGLPKGLELGGDVHCISVQAQNFYESPDMFAPILPTPIGKSGQSFREGKELRGSVLAFEFAEPLEEASCDFLRGVMWGEKGPTKEHPERLLFSGRFFVVISFPDGDPDLAWFQSQLEERLKALAPHDWTALQPLMDQAVAAMDGGDAEKALALLQQYADKIQDYALAQYVLGEAAVANKQWPVAQAAYTRALELNDAGTDLLSGPPMVWGAVDGLALALMQQDSNKEAVLVLERGVSLVRGLGDAKKTGRALYNFACGLARVGRFEDSLKALTECIQLTPDHKAMAVKDSDFAKARERPDFKKLLGD